MLGLILDTDIGDDIDDVFALAYAALHPDIELLAVTTVWNDTRWKAALSLTLLDTIGVVDIPVAAGFGAEDGAASARPVKRMSGDVLVPLDATDPRTDTRHAVELTTLRPTPSAPSGSSPSARPPTPPQRWIATLSFATGSPDSQ